MRTGQTTELKLIAAILFTAVAFLTLPAQATDDEALLEARAELRAVYQTRGDLQSLFDSGTWLPARTEQTIGIRDLEDWALQYGFKEHDELRWYGTSTAESILVAVNKENVPDKPRALVVDKSAEVPRKISGDPFDFSSITATSVFVADEASRRVLLTHNADESNADAATAKLMTAAVALERSVNLESYATSTFEDEIGGLSVNLVVGSRMSVGDWMYASLIGSANNATRTLARSTGLTVPAFTSAMNSTAREWGLVATSFADPSGVIDGSATTVTEAAVVLAEALEHDAVQRVTTTGMRRLGSGLTVHNRNVLLTDPNNGLYVYGGQIGYLRESGWHMSVKMMDLKKEKPLLIAVAGADSKEDLFDDVAAIARWAWANHEWGQADEMTLTEARVALRGIYDKRGDLRQLFDSGTWRPVRSEQTAGIVDLEDWAMQYGFSEHSELWWYGTERAQLVVSGEIVEEPPKQVVASSPRALDVRPTTHVPVNATGADFPMISVTSESVFVVDVPSRRVILAENADEFHVMASLTKLMTGMVALEQGPPMGASVQILDQDEIGGASLRGIPEGGTTLSMQDLMYSMLVGSANNAAHAIARATSGSVDSFVGLMNEKAESFGLKNTTLADPSGLDVDNVSTAREIAAVALEAWDIYSMRKMCSTDKYALTVAREDRIINNTNGLLTDNVPGLDTTDLIVLGGKTGFLYESMWNLAVKIMDERQKPILVVVLGSDTKNQLFRDAHTVADWVWENYRWR